MLVIACTVWLSSFQRYSRDVSGAPLHMFKHVRGRFVVSAGGRVQVIWCGVGGCMSNGLLSWVFMVLLGACVGL